MTMIVSQMTRRILLVTKSINHSVVLEGGVVATLVLALHLTIDDNLILLKNHMRGGNI